MNKKAYLVNDFWAKVQHKTKRITGKCSKYGYKDGQGKNEAC